jgi:hypothetical protein
MFVKVKSYMLTSEVSFSKKARKYEAWQQQVRHMRQVQGSRLCRCRAHSCPGGAGAFAAVGAIVCNRTGALCLARTAPWSHAVTTVCICTVPVPPTACIEQGLRVLLCCKTPSSWHKLATFCMSAAAVLCNFPPVSRHTLL